MNMDKNRRLELIYFTRQYPTFVKALGSLRTMWGKAMSNEDILDDNGNIVNVDEVKLARSINYFDEKVKMIDYCAKKACSGYDDIWDRLIILSVINKWSYDKMIKCIGAECSKENFDNARNRFLELLDERRG